jgi:hypothetical protein
MELKASRRPLRPNGLTASFPQSVSVCRHVTLPSVHRAFIDWLEEVRLRLAIALEVRGRVGRHIELSFDGIHPAIGASLTSRELSVFADWQGQTWDLLLSLDVLPRRARSGYICELCQPEERPIFPNLEALWRDHLFEPLLTWVNTRLAISDALDLYGSPSSGSTHAELVSKHHTEGTEPNIRIPVRVLQHH